METVGQQVQSRVVFSVSVQGTPLPLQVAVMLAEEPHGHLVITVAVQEFPLITALALPPVPAEQTTLTVIELLVQFATVPLTETWLAPAPSGVATIEVGLIDIVHISHSNNGPEGLVDLESRPAQHWWP